MRFLAASEGLDDAHYVAATGAWFSQCEGDDVGGWRVILFGGLCTEQYANFFDTGLSLRAGEQTIVANAVEPVREDMDEEASDELEGGETHDVLFVAGFDAIIFPSERDGAGIGTDQAAV